MLSTSQERALLFLTRSLNYKREYMIFINLVALRLIGIVELAEYICSFLSFPENISILRMSLLKGAAGSGKTYCVSRFLKEIPIDWNIVVSSPTHKAKSVIMKQMIELGCSHRISIFNTVSSLLVLKKTYDKDGDFSFLPGWGKDMGTKPTLIIIDEASMISETHYLYLKEMAEKNTNIIICFIADHLQLPPVEEGTSPIFHVGMKEFIMSGNIRAKTEELSELVQKIRRYVEGEQFNIYNVKHIFRKHLFLKHIYNTFVFGRDKVLTYSITQKERYNHLIRDHFFNKPKDIYVSGEKIVFTDFFTDRKGSFFTGDEVCIQRCTITIKKHPTWNICCKVYKAELGDGKTIYIVHEDDKENYMLRAAKEKKNTLIRVKHMVNRAHISQEWNEYNTSFALFYPPIDYSYAKTIYQSQGSTYGKVYVDVDNIYGCMRYAENKMFARSLYTAVSRASDEVILFCTNNIF